MARDKDSAELSEKQETIGQLYALRAGLSVIAQEKEAADGIMSDAYAAKEQAIARADGRIKCAEQTVSERLSELSALVKEQNELEKKAKSQGLLTRIIAVLFCGIFWLPPLAIIAYGISMICCWEGAFGKDWAQNPILDGMYTWTEYAGIWSLVPCIVATAIVGFVSLIICALIAKAFKYSYAQKKRAKRELKTFESRLQSKRQVIQEAESAVCNARTQRQSDIAAADKEFSKGGTKSHRACRCRACYDKRAGTVVRRYD